MAGFALDPALQGCSHLLIEADGWQLRLHENAEVLWLILIPHTEITEFTRLPQSQQQPLLDVINSIGDCLERHWHCDKINIASIGNVVAQMHIHVIGRFVDDCYWPAVVWEKPYRKTCSAEQVATLSEQLSVCLLP